MPTRLGIRIRLLAATTAAAALALGAGTAAGRAHFGRAAQATIPAKHLLDLGVADFDGDGFLDLFTTNHKYRAALLRNRGGHSFHERRAEVGLSPTPDFPGLELLRRPSMKRPGVYLFMRSPTGKHELSHVYVRTVGMEAAGRLTFGSHSVEVARRAHAHVTLRRSRAGQPTVTFEAGEGAVIDIGLQQMDLPIEASFEGVEPGDIRVGTMAVPARERSFALTLRDRHGLAFADLGGNRDTDVFAVSGGLGGAISRPTYAGLVQDELLVRRDERFVNESAGSGLDKGTCRGRQSAVADVDGDGLLDLFESCEEAPPRIYRQLSSGRFEPSPAPHSIASTYRWADISGDGRPELLAAEEHGIRIYRVGAGGSELIQRIDDNARGGVVTQFAVADLDDDGDLDVLAVSRSGSTMLVNRGGRLHRTPLRALGLPQSSVAASFVDYDNDGQLDLHLVPQGLFHRAGPDDFRRTGEAATPAAGAAITAWFDYDNDGLRDPVIATGRSEFSAVKEISRARNLGPGGHWLEVDLAGPDGNAQAIGARVRVRCQGHREFGFVGQNDDSRLSQGHYRLYFGLGSCARVSEATVRWPDGTHDDFGPLRTDRLVRLAYPRG